MSVFKVASIVGTVGAIALTGCTRPTSQPKSETAATAPVAAGTSSNVRMLGPEFNQLFTCADLAHKRKIAITEPVVAYKLTIKDLDIKSLKGRPVKKRAATGGKDEDVTSPETDADPAGHPDPTRWDFDLGLKAPATGSPHQAVLIKLVSGDSDVTFRDDEHAITAGDQNGQMMFCGLTNEADGPRFWAIYYNDGKYPTFGSFNIGLYVRDRNKKTKYRTPVFIDPNVKNYG